jgi:hypothetical protein
MCFGDVCVLVLPQLSRHACILHLRHLVVPVTTVRVHVPPEFNNQGAHAWLRGAPVLLT